MVHKEAEFHIITDHLGRNWLIINNNDGTLTLSTPLFAYEDMDEFLYIANELLEQGAQGGELCGMRFFASLKDHMPRALVNLRNILATKTPILKKVLKSIDKEESMGKVLDDKGTVEVFPFAVANDLDPNEMKACIQLGCAMVTQAINQNRVNTTSATHYENERYAFRCWMLRMGLIGDEYKMCRSRLMARVEGDSAQRTRRKPV